jgi:DNA (cytosine-5)-methyltransferase 1
MGFDAKWGVLGAADIGANHQRDRIWIVAKWRGQIPHAQYNRIRWWEQQQKSLKEAHGKLADPSKYRIQSQSSETRKSSQWINSSGIGNSEWWAIEPNVGRVADGVAARVDRLKSIGNGQVSEVARRAWELLSDKR